MPAERPDTGKSLWYALTGKQQPEQIGIIAAASPSGNCCIMCTTCGHVFIDGKPFTGESDTIGNVTLARQLYYHSCEMEGSRREPPR